MDPIRRVTGAPPITPRAGRGAVSGFQVPAARTEAAASVAGLEEIGVPGMFLLQEQPDTADHRASKRGRDLLAALADLQRSLLSSGPVDTARLVALSEDVPLASDPALRGAVQAIVLRARIETARLTPGQTNSPPEG